MTRGQQQSRWILGGGALVLLIIAVPLWNEFRVTGNVAWNVFLGVFLIGLGIGAILLQRYFRQHASEVGEARFDTSNKPKDL